MDDDPGWRPLAVGELIAVGPDLAVRSSTVIDGPPAHPLHPHRSSGGLPRQPV